MHLQIPAKIRCLISTIHAFVRYKLFPNLHFRTMKINLTVSQAKGIHDLRPADAEISMCMCAVHHASAYQIICVR